MEPRCAVLDSYCTEQRFADRDSSVLHAIRARLIAGPFPPVAIGLDMGDRNSWCCLLYQGVITNRRPAGSRCQAFSISASGTRSVSMLSSPLAA
jgi:hypothetical protein